MNDYAERSTRTQAVLRMFLAAPDTWLDVQEIAKKGGFSGWRTRVSEARQLIKREGRGDIEWNGKVRMSAYRYVPTVRVQPVTQIGLFATENV